MTTFRITVAHDHDLESSTNHWIATSEFVARDDAGEIIVVTTEHAAALEAALDNDPAVVAYTPLLTEEDVEAALWYHHIALIAATEGLSFEQVLWGETELDREHEQEEHGTAAPPRFTGAVYEAALARYQRGADMVQTYMVATSPRFDATVGPAQGELQLARSRGVSVIVRRYAGHRARTSMQCIHYLVPRPARPLDLAAVEAGHADA